MKIFIIYSSLYGQTEKISFKMTQVAQSRGFKAQAIDVNSAEAQSINEDCYVILGSSIYIGKSDSALRRWAKKYHWLLENVPSAFFTVSLNAAV